jgi:hypothetical protein
MATTFMGLDLPTVSSTIGPDWATDLNAALTTVDAHDHTSSKGTKVPAAGLNINAALTFANNDATNVNGVTLKNNTSDHATNITAYAKNGDFYFKDSAGNAVRITSGGALDLSGTGGITGDYTTTSATAFYTDSVLTYFWQDSATDPAIMSFGTAEVGDGTVLLPAYSFTSDKNTGIYSGGADSLKFSTGGVEALELDSSQDANFAGKLVVTSTGSTIPSPVLTTPQINDTSSDHQYIFAASELVANRTVTLPLLTGNDEFTFNDHAQILTNKTFTLPQINDTSSDHQYVFAVSELAADRTVTLPLLTGADQFTFDAHQTTLTNKIFSDSTVQFGDNADTTKKLDFSLGGATTAKTATIASSHTDDRTITLPDASDTLMGKATTDTMTNKTFDANGTGNSLSNVDLTEDVINTLPLGNGGTGQTTKTAAMDGLSPTSAKGDVLVDDGTNVVSLTAGTNGQVLTADSSEASGLKWGAGGGTSGEINYISNFGFEDESTTGWAGFDDGAVSIPVDGTTTTPSLLTLSAQSGTILRDNQSMKIEKATGDAQGQGFSYDFTIKTQDISKKLKIQFDFKTDEDAAYTSGEWGVWVYDVTNSTLITPVDVDIIAGQNIFQTSFNSTTSTSYRLILMATTTLNDAYDIYFDNFIVGPGMTSQGAAIGPWTAYTPTTQGFGTIPAPISSVGLEYRRVGDSIEVRGDFTTGTTTASEAQLNLPSGLTIGQSGTITQCGMWLRDVTTANIRGTILSTSGDAFVNFSRPDFDTSTASPLTSQNGSTVAGSSEKWSIQFMVPVSEWAGKGIVPMLAEDNLSEWTAYTPTGTWSTNTTYTGFYKRVGEEMELDITVSTSGAPTSATLNVNLPSGFTVDTSKLSNTNTVGGYTLGSATVLDSGTGSFIAMPKYKSTTALEMNVVTGSGTEVLVNATTPMTFASGDTVHILARVPITEWAGSQNSLVGYSLADKEATGLAPAGVFEAGIEDAITLQERSTHPADPSSSSEGRIYVKGDLLIIQFNDGGTVRYKYLDLTGTGVTWVHTTSAP